MSETNVVLLQICGAEPLSRDSASRKRGGYWKPDNVRDSNRLINEATGRVSHTYGSATANNH